MNIAETVLIATSALWWAGRKKRVSGYLGVRGAGKKSVVSAGMCEGARDLLKVRRGGCGRPGEEWGSDCCSARPFFLGNVRLHMGKSAEEDAYFFLGQQKKVSPPERHEII